ncbi:anti-sigma factor [Pseudosporangium ferrugineum]|uniref:Regulator of SigK n=1 Tax=Pseudosporangium ferrugineum TaxID=439699 RepID=A0A2T0SDC8_9ACTN|nr:anti-sigma factor [Pseudosporangium ferrugineum]PRY31430.1 anti-sigma-K factor RskA [Pseudosporangium ferrugineum]
MTSAEVHSLVGAYALDAVDDLERAAFERHMAGCAACRNELDELRETAARMADSTWSVPPPGLRTEVMAAIGRTRQLPPADLGGQGAGDRPSRWRRYTVAAAAAVVLAAGTGATVYAIQDQRVRDQSAIATAARQYEARTRDILSAPDVVFRTSPMRGGGKVTVASSASRDAGVVLLGADVAPAGDRAFQLWAIRGNTPTTAGVLAAGEASAVRIVDGLPGSDGLGVTLEPAGGSATPTQPLVAQVPLV